MGMIVKIKKLSRMSVLLLIVFSVILLSGCGKSDAPPPGAVLTMEALDTPTPFLQSGATLTSSVTTQKFRVTVIDADGNPLDNVKVDLEGQFTAGENILFAGVQTTQPAPTIYSSVTTGNYGIKDFIVSALTYTTAPLLDVTGLIATPSSATGSLVNGVTYDYSVTAVDSVGLETKSAATLSTLVSTPTCTITSCGIITITWSPVQRASGYNVYGRIAGSEGLMTATKLSNTTFTFTDHGTEPINPLRTPPGSNSSGTSLNPVKGTITATSGPLISTVDVAF